MTTQLWPDPSSVRPARRRPQIALQRRVLPRSAPDRSKRTVHGPAMRGRADRTDPRSLQQPSLPATSAAPRPTCRHSRPDDSDGTQLHWVHRAVARWRGWARLGQVNHHGNGHAESCVSTDGQPPAPVATAPSVGPGGCSGGPIRLNRRGPLMPKPSTPTPPLADPPSRRAEPSIR